MSYIDWNDEQQKEDHRRIRSAFGTAFTTRKVYRMELVALNMKKTARRGERGNQIRDRRGLGWWGWVWLKK